MGEPAKTLPAELNDDPFADEISTACYLCHGQCANFGTHGKGGLRPCAKGVSDIINRRHLARLESRARR